MTTHSTGGWVETALPIDATEPGPIVVLRSWLVVPERLPLDRLQPMLTGLYGYPWRSARLDARCTASNRLDRDFTLPPRIERHHRTVPAPGCSCGVYAVRPETSERVALRSPVGVPTVTGFVELSGRIITGGATYRAQKAAIVGPLTLEPGRPPLLSLLRRSARPQRVATVGTAYQVRWAGRPAGRQWVEWAIETAETLGDRYEVEVLTARV